MNRWLRSIPVDSPDARLQRLQEEITKALEKRNTVQIGDAVAVRIPKLDGQIRLVPKDKHNQSFYVEYIYDRWYDEEKKQSRNSKAIIGTVFSLYPNAMIPNERYHDFFDIQTGKPLKKRP